MKSLIFVLLVLAAPARAAYFETFFQDPKHPVTSASAIWTAEFKSDGAVADLAVLFHRPDANDSLLFRACPACKDAGLRPIGWSLVEIGAGGNAENGFFTFGSSVDASPTVLGPLSDLLKRQGGKCALAGSLLYDDKGNGLKLSIRWKAEVISGGIVQPFDRWRFPPRYGIGYRYLWGG